MQIEVLVRWYPVYVNFDGKQLESAKKEREDLELKKPALEKRKRVSEEIFSQFQDLFRVPDSMPHILQRRKLRAEE